ncbi:MAG: glycerophosphodiester phosphodiesterase [Thermodesulfobacteriota bacterium]
MRYSLTRIPSWILLLLFLVCQPTPSEAALVIARGGAAGYLMENNHASTSLAAAMGADIIKLDLVLSRDREVLVHGATTLNRGTNVAELFPDRARKDGLFYVFDFSLDELRSLTLRDPAGRFPADLEPRLTIPTLAEELSLLRGLETGLTKKISVGVEIKQPWLHRKEGLDVATPTLNTLRRYGYSGRDNDTYLFSYDAAELQRIGKELLPEREMMLKLVQLIESNEGEESKVEEWGQWVSYNYDWMFSNTGLRSLAGSVAAIALPKYMLVDPQGRLKMETFVKNAQQLGTMIFTFPLARDTGGRRSFGKSLEEELEFLISTVKVDGLITDFCGDVSTYLRNRVQPQPVEEKEATVSPQTPLPGDLPQQLTPPMEIETGE